MPDGTVERFLDRIDANLMGALIDGYRDLSAAMETPLQLLLILFVAVYGFSMLFGAIQVPVRTSIRHILLATFVYILVIQADDAAAFLTDVFVVGPGQVAGAVVGGPGGSDIDSVNETVGDAFDEGMDAAYRIMEQGGWTEWAPVLLGMGVVVIIIFMIGYALFLIVLAKIALTALLLLTPLFVPLLMFSQTRGIFEGWLRQVINFALVPILVYTILALTINLAVEASMQVQSAGGAELTDVAPLYLVGAVTFLLLLQVLGIAGGIAGGISLNTLGAIGSSMQRAGRRGPTVGQTGGAIKRGGQRLVRRPGARPSGT